MSGLTSSSSSSSVETVKKRKTSDSSMNHLRRKFKRLKRMNSSGGGDEIDQQQSNGYVYHSSIKCEYQLANKQWTTLQSGDWVRILYFVNNNDKDDENDDVVSCYGFAEIVELKKEATTIRVVFRWIYSYDDLVRMSKTAVQSLIPFLENYSSVFRSPQYAISNDTHVDDISCIVAVHPKISVTFEVNVSSPIAFYPLSRTHDDINSATRAVILDATHQLGNFKDMMLANPMFMWQTTFGNLLWNEWIETLQPAGLKVFALRYFLTNPKQPNTIMFDSHGKVSIGGMKNGLAANGIEPKFEHTSSVKQNAVCGICMQQVGDVELESLHSISSSSSSSSSLSSSSSSNSSSSSSSSSTSSQTLWAVSVTHNESKFNLSHAPVHNRCRIRIIKVAKALKLIAYCYSRFQSYSPLTDADLQLYLKELKTLCPVLNHGTKLARVVEEIDDIACDTS
jgi:hypothetical protein